MDSMQLHDIALHCEMLAILYFAISSFIQCANIKFPTIDGSDYRRGKTSSEYVNVRC